MRFDDSSNKKKTKEERSQRMESSGAILWDFVGWHCVTLCPFGRS